MSTSKVKLLIVMLLTVVCGISALATDAGNLRIYLNPGHGSWGPNDRPMATIPYPNLSSTGRPDTCGFYESNTNLWKALKTRETLINVGVSASNIVMSRVKNGPYPYVSGASDAELYNRNLSEICEEADAGNFDMFFSIHSNSTTDGNTSNYSLYLYRGTDASDYASGSKAMAQAMWPLASVGVNQLDYASHYTSTTNIHGDIDFYGSSSTRAGSKGNYTGFLGVLKHGVPGFLSEGYFQTYRPARHRALNSDYCGQEGVRYARGIMNYFGLSGETTGYIMGTVKDKSKSVTDALYASYATGSTAGDEYWPVMGATVELYSGSALVDTYTTDNNYNGVFVFEDLTPGTYTIKTTANGYIDKTETVTVTANATTYPHIYVTADATTETPSITSLELENDGGTDYSSQITGDVIYTAQHDDHTALLTNDSGTPHLYLIDNSSKQVQSMSLTGFSTLNAISFTDDGKLVGCAATNTTFNGSAVITFYKWDSYSSAPVAWITSNNSGNFYNALVGETFAISGNSNTGRLIYTAVNTGNTTGAIRYVNVNITNGSGATATYAKTSTVINKSEIGSKMYLRPLSNGNFILDAENTTPYELDISTTNGGTTDIVNSGSSTLTTAANRGDYFTLDGNLLTVQTLQNASGNNTGIVVYNIDNGISSPSEVTTTNTSLTATAADYQAVHATADSNDGPTFYLVKDKTIVKFVPQTSAEDPDDDDTTPRGVFAYGLDLNDNGNNSYTFTFTPNVKPQAARLVFYDSNGNEVGNGITLSNVTAGENSFTFSKSELPGTVNDGDMTWGVELEGKAVTAFTKLNTDNAAQWAFTRACPIVDNSPESDYFGRIYASVWEGLSNSANGIWAYNPDWSRLNTSVFRNFYDASGTAVVPRTNYRLGIDYTGTVYMSEYGDPTSGIFLVYPDRIVNNHHSYNFFSGTRASSGLWTSGSTEVGSSTSAVSVAGTGTDTKLYMLIEDFANNKNDVAVYNLVDASTGAFQMTWSKAPSRILDVSGSGTTNCGQLHADDKGGVWISHYLHPNSNNTSAALVYSNSNGSVVFNSSAISSTLNGTRGGGFAVSPDNSRLAIGDADGNICLYNITWSGTTPSLTYVNKFTGVDVKDNTTSSTNRQSNGIYQMSFDWGGNLVVGGNGIGIYSVPTGSTNKTVTPAKKRLTVSHTPARVYTLANLRVCLDPGHGGFTSNDRNMQTINHALGDTTGFYESNTNLRKMFGARAALKRMGLNESNIVMTRYRNSTAPGLNDYDIPLSERRAIADQGNFDIFVSVHSNASGDYNSNGEFVTLIENGVYGNFPLFIYRGRTGNPALKHSDEMAEVIWRSHWLTTDIDPQSRPEITIDDPYIVGDLDYYDPTINTGAGKGPEWGYSSITGQTNYGYLGVLKHSVPGLLIEGFCHQYHPATQRALNDDYCAMMGIKIARGIVDYFNLPGENTGYIMGTVKDRNRSLENNLYKYKPGSVDAYYPINGATVKLYSGNTLLDTYTTDDEYNGVFMFYNLAPGAYRLVTSYSGYDDDEQTVTVEANETTYPLVYLESDDTPAKGIFAYGLSSERNTDGSYNFTFTANAKSKAASLIFYNAVTGAQVGDPVVINNVQEGNVNTVTLTQEQLPGAPGQELNWAVSLTGKTINSISKLNTVNSSTFDYTRASVVVDNSPESDYFGSVYVNDRKTRNASSNTANRDNGIYRYNPLWTRENSSPYTGNMAWDNNYRLAIDYHGTLYIPDYGDNHSGIFIAYPDKMTDTWQNFFAGSRTVSSGVITSNGVVTGCSSPSAFILGTGADSKLYAPMEDMQYYVYRYDIGSQIDSVGNLPAKWYTAPVRINNTVLNYKSGSVNSNTYAIAQSDGGVWVSQNEYSGMEYTLAALRFITADGTSYRDFTSSLATNLNGCAGGGFALSPDESQIIITDVNGNLQFYDIDRSGTLPSLTWVKSFSPDVKDTYSATANLGGQVKNGIYQLAFDHGGNLYVAGKSLGIYSMPQADNTHVTPAKKALTVMKDAIADVTLSQLVAEGRQGKVYHIINTLTCVYIHNAQTLYCKDNNAYADKSVQGERINYMELRALQTGAPDQSNWIAVNLPQALTVDLYEDYLNSEITGITGTYVDSLNPTITLTEMPTAGNSVDEYSPNVFIPANFIEENWNNTTYFFNRPKPMEYAEITWAVYDGEAFYVPIYDGKHNVERLKGGFYPDFSMLPDDAGITPEEFFVAGKSYRFKAVIKYRPTGTPSLPARHTLDDTPLTDAISNNYTVFPLEMDRYKGIITDVNTVAAERTVVAVKYYTPAGIELHEAPDSGIFIEVTVYDDGSRESRKLIK